MKKYSSALLAVPLVASMLLAGCGGDAKPDASSSSSPTSSPTTTSSPTSAAPTTAGPKVDPNIPAAARAHTPAGAEAFVRYFIEQVNLAWTGPRAGIVSPLCQASSKSCAALESTATRLATERHRYDGNPLAIVFIGTLDATNTKSFEVLATLVQERRSEVDATGKIYVTDPRKSLRFDFQVAYTGQAWSVSSMKTTT